MNPTRCTLHGVLLLLCLYLSAPLHAQKLTVRGKVTSAADAQPLDDVLVRLQDGKEKTRTDKDGSYRIEVELPFFTPGPEPVLEFSKKGFESRQLNVAGQKRVDVVMRPEGGAESLLFQTGLAAPQEVITLPFSATTIEQPTLSRSLPDQLSYSLMGRVPGLRVLQPGGQPGQEFYYQLRAANALSGTQQPLILVDGIYLDDAALMDLNPEDVAKIEVLPGGAGAARYGSQGGQGVLQIWTKDGAALKDGETRITYSTAYGQSSPHSSLPLSGFFNREVTDPSGPQPVLGGNNATDTYTTPLPNEQDYRSELLFRDGSLRSNSLRFSGRSGGTHFMASAQRLRDIGILQNNRGYTRHNFRANLGHQASARLKVFGKAMYTSSEQEFLPTQSARAANPLANTLLLTPIFDLQARNEEDGSEFDWDIDNTGNRITNPLYLQEQINRIRRRNRLLGTFGGEWAITRWLDFDYNATLDRATEEEEVFVDKGYLSTTLPAGFGPAITAGPRSNGGGLQQQRYQSSYFTSEASLRLHKQFLGFRLNTRAGLLYEYRARRYELVAGESLAVREVRSFDNLQENIRTSSRRTEMTTYSGFLLADANYKQKYLFSGAFRTEQSTLFGESVDWPAFYRVAAGYRLSEDVNLRFFQELKLQAAFSRSGIRPEFEQRFETYRLLNGTLTRQTIANPQLEPAYVESNEIGLTATFLRCFTLSGTYAQTTTSNQILRAPLSGGTGFEAQWRNAGTVEADVFEAALNIDLKKLFRIPGSRVRWNIGANGQRIEQRVAALGLPAYTTGPGLPNTSLFRIEEGQPLGLMAGHVFARTVEQLAEQPDINLLEYTTNSLGYIVRADQLGTPEERPVLLRDENGNPLQQVIGNINPDFQIGFSHTFAVGGFELFTLFDWRKGGDVYNFTRQQLYQAGRHAELSENSDIAAGFFGPQGLSHGMQANAHFVEDGSYLTLREAAISLRLQPDQLPFMDGLMQEIRLSLIGRNLFTMTDYSGYHPALNSGLNTRGLSAEAGSDPSSPGGNPALFAVDYFNYPLRRTLSISLQITL